MTGGSSKPKIGIIVGVVGGLILFLLGGMLFLVCRGRHKGYKREVFVDVPGLSFSEHRKIIVKICYCTTNKKLNVAEFCFDVIKFFWQKLWFVAQLY